MKHFKKFFSYLVALTMVLSLAAFTGTKVNAEGKNTDGYTLTLTNKGRTTHIFEVYQIFKGDLNGDTLSNIKWGSGVSNDVETALGDPIAKAETLSGKGDDSPDAVAFAESLQSYLTGGKEVSVDANTSTKVSGLVAGYYLVKDRAESQKDQEYGAATSYILKVVKDTTAETKLDVPTVTKKVKDTNDSTGETGWQDSADADINDDVQYQITGTMPANIDKYTTYKYVFTDTMSKGLTYTAGKATITIDGKDVTGLFTENVTTGDNGTTVTWSCDNLKTIEGVTLSAATTVVVNYKATLNKDAVVGSAGNSNTVYLTYSNNPNNGGSGETGKTPTDKNIVFTYKTVVNKVDQDQKSLKGAAFKLEKIKSDGKSTVVKEFTAGDATTFEFTGLDDGNYKLTETTTPAGYNTIAPIEFTISATHDAESDNPQLTDLSGDVKSGEATFTAAKETGSLSTDVVNKKGSTLPSTGGMGTTLLYVAGGILVACAAAYVVMSRKHSTNK